MSGVSHQATEQILSGSARARGWDTGGLPYSVQGAQLGGPSPALLLRMVNLWRIEP